MLPNFLIIGAPKSGTTTLDNILNQHPEIFMCPIKECGFFWTHGEQINLRGPGVGIVKSRLVSELNEYIHLFRGVRNEKAIGEASVRYLSNIRTPGLIDQFIPNAKLIAILRHPVDRAYSSYMHRVRDGVEITSNFEEAITEELAGLRGHYDFLRYLEVGFYYKHLLKFNSFYKNGRMHISLFEDLKNNSQDLFHDLFQFLEVDQSFIPDTSHQHNVSGIIRNPILRYTWTKSQKYRTWVGARLPPRIRHAVTEVVIHDLMKPSPCPPDLYAHLIHIYREDIEKLQNYIGRDLSHWLASG